MINWSVSDSDFRSIDRIMENLDVPPRHRQNLEMGLIACHNSGCPLDLETMAGLGKTSDVVHDVYGIDRHIDKTTGKLGDCFWPRYAKEQ